MVSECCSPNSLCELRHSQPREFFLFLLPFFLYHFCSLTLRVCPWFSFTTSNRASHTRDRPKPSSSHGRAHPARPFSPAHLFPAGSSSIMALYSAYDARSVSPRMPDSNAGPSSSLDQQKPFAWSAPQLQPGSHQGTAATQPDLAFEAAHRWPPALPLSTATASPSSTEAVQSTLSTGSLQQHYPPMAHVSALLQSRSRPNSFADRPNVADLAQRRFSTPPLHHASSQGESFQQTWAAQHPHLASSEAANTTGWRSTGSPSLPSVYSDFSTMPQLRALNTAVSQPSGAPSSYSLSPVTCVPPTYFNYAPTPPTTAASRPVSTSSAYGSLQSLPHLTTSSLDPGQSAPTLASIPSTPAPSSSSNSISDSSSLRRSGTGSSRLESTGPDRSSKQFKCDICPQSFNRNHDLKRHKVSMRGIFLKLVAPG